MFHALGLLSSAVENKFGDILSVWDKGLRDIDGDAPKAAMSITDDHSDRSNTFDLYSKEERDKLEVKLLGRTNPFLRDRRRT